MRKQILLAILLFGLSMQQCSIGCQVCSSTNTCLLCDITNSYYLANNACLISTLTNCKVLAQNGNCALCNTGYYVDPVAFRCLAIPTAGVVANCQYYGSNQACVTCQSGFYISANLCVAVSTTVANCNAYSANGVCNQCASGYILNYSLATCITIPTNLNCLTYTFVGCQICSSGYFTNQNNYVIPWSAPVISNGLLVNVILQPNSWQALSTCQAIVTPNCATNNQFNVCISCNTGYYLQNGFCVAFQLPTIWGCIVYSSATACAQCQAGLYRYTTVQCVNNVPIANCVNYDGAASSTACLACNSTYYLSSSTVCSLRVTSLNINNCLTNSGNTDKCATCMSGYQLTNDGLACLPSIQFCSIYVTSSISSNFLVCATCIPGYYLFNSNLTLSCVQGSIANCGTYVEGGSFGTQNVCLWCNNGFYLTNGLCVAHANITNCVTFSNYRANACVACNQGFYPFDVTTLCVATAGVANCAILYPDGVTCANCTAGYYPQGNTCVLIPSGFTNCINFNGAACVHCATNYMINTLTTGGRCILMPDYLIPTTTATSSCNNYTALQTLTTAGGITGDIGYVQVPTWEGNPFNDPLQPMINAPLTCNACNLNYYPYRNYFNEAICVNTNDLGLYQGYSTASTANCRRFGLSLDLNFQLICMECNSGYYIIGFDSALWFSAPISSTNPSGIQCQSGCPFTGTGGPNMIISDTTWGFVNVCYPDGVTKLFAAANGCTRAVIARTPNPLVFPSAGGFTTAYRGAAVCFSTNQLATPITVTPTNYLYVTNDWTDYAALLGNAEAPYRNQVIMYETITPTISKNVVAGTAALTIAFDYSNGYSTIDTGIYPSIFNYKGIDWRFQASPVAGILALSATTLIATYVNCDLFIVYRVSKIFYGLAFNTAATSTYNPAVVTTGAVACMRCAMGYAIAYPTTISATAANNVPFPSCQSNKLSSCSSGSAIYGGLSTHLNSIYSCHKCTAGLVPTIRIEIDVTPDGAAVDITAAGNFIGWQVKDIYPAALVVGTNNYQVSSGVVMNCEAIPTNIVDATGTATAYTGIAALNAGTVQLCAAIAHINAIILSPTAAADGTGSTVVPICSACIANYFPIYGIATFSAATHTWGAGTLLPAWAVIGCTASSNCDTTVVTQFNACGKCRSDTESATIPSYYAFHDPTVTNCYVSKTKNCFILVYVNGLTNNGQYDCMVCKSGYFLNADGACESVTVQNMASTALFSRPYLASKYFLQATSYAGYANLNVFTVPTSEFYWDLRIHTLLTATGNQYGVSACNSGWTLAPASYWLNTICIGSSYLKAGQLILTTKFIANCINYQNQNVLGSSYFAVPLFAVGAGLGGTPTTVTYLCQTCATGYIPALNRQSCVSLPSLTNCLLLTAGGATCQTCAAGYYNLNGACSNTLITNCLSYSNTVTFNAQATLLCTACAQGYSLSAAPTVCTIGKVPNCATYQTASLTQCVTCLNGYTLINEATNNANNYYCYPVPITYNCMRWQSVSTQSGANYDTLSCSQCNNTASTSFGLTSYVNVLTASSAVNNCLPFAAVSNCIAYNQNNTVVAMNTFACSRCSDLYWLSITNNVCTLRVNNPVQCASTDPLADNCLTCINGFYLSSNKCLPYPNGIYGCSTYATLNACTLCLPGFYLFYNKCIPSTIVPNCQVYSGNYTCSACQSSYFLQSNTSCIVPNATNCLLVSNINTCATCPSNNGFLTTNGVTSCVSNAVANCAVATTVANAAGTFQCINCTAPYYPNANGTCIQTTVIPGCLVYDSATTCLTCNSTSVLYVGRTACNLTAYAGFTDPNCQAHYLLSNPVCNQCALGSYFFNGTCSPCPASALSFGCLQCNPSAPSSCLICSPSYYMNQVGICIRNVNLPVNPTPSVPSPVSSISRAIALTLGLAAIYFDEL